ncbi:hypothetical protein DPR00_03640 [Burkholderia pseudomallei]|nr:hypothetical protein EGY14_22350 [Burkholderia pseudomallei]NRE35115.1 hypothetical protein [Burkholderia pseudomallei]QBI43078.1 hypothetical protein EXY28_25655 [Burkholderia pseudomallei]QBP51487.1 hypothetical protein E2R28_25405 [Burkholderia pseudomallei]QBP64759.1 hypothetical protein E2R29_25385 [Burkholderia pseudomallei]
MVCARPAVLYQSPRLWVNSAERQRPDVLRVLETVAERLYEPRRVLWRLQLLREWSHEQEAGQVFPGSPVARSAPGTRAA